ncbi:hypothetical protein ACQKH5_07910 [Hyphomonas sp. NPDC076900]|uniref:hypothetical protein n=1 Tax=unclassified Hyphomonas TaxID=2630699 RepID=UPI003CFC5A96
MKHLRYWPLFAFALLAACSPAPEETPAALPQDERMAVPETAPGGPAEQDMPAQPASCADEVGAAAAQVLVDQCLAISPATRPPCNAQNSCDMIRDEIRRGCGIGDAGDNPAFCGEY